jgi:hypothetical protein
VVQSSARLKGHKEPETEKPKMRYPHWVQLADHDRVPRLLELGWEKSTGLIDTNKGLYGCIMVWPHETEPPNE